MKWRTNLKSPFSYSVLAMEWDTMQLLGHFDDSVEGMDRIVDL